MSDPNTYLLNLAQAAVAGQATRFQMKLRRSDVELFFDSPELAKILPQKLAGLLQGDLRDRDPAVTQVVAGLRSAREVGRGSMHWTAWDGQRTHRLEISPEGSKLPPAEKTRPWPDGSVGCRLQLAKPASRRVGHVSPTASEHRLAYTRLRFAPLAITVDGRSINDASLPALIPEGLVEEVLAENYSRRFLLAERYLVPRWPMPHLWAAPPPSQRLARAYRFSTQSNAQIAPVTLHEPQGLLYEALRVWELPGQTTAGPTGPAYPALRYQLPSELGARDTRPMACVAALAIPLALEGPSKVYVVENGVVLEAQTAELGCPGAVALLSAQGLTVEGLRATPDLAWEERLEFLRLHIQEMLKQVHSHIGLMEFTDPALVRYVRGKL